jgi:hypothetical protein
MTKLSIENIESLRGIYLSVDLTGHVTNKTRYAIPQKGTSFATLSVASIDRVSIVCQMATLDFSLIHSIDNRRLPRSS